MTDMDTTIKTASTLAKLTGVSYAVIETDLGLDAIALRNWIPAFGKIIGIIQPSGKQAG